MLLEDTACPGPDLPAWHGDHDEGAKWTVVTFRQENNRIRRAADAGLAGSSVSSGEQRPGDAVTGDVVIAKLKADNHD